MVKENGKGPREGWESHLTCAGLAPTQEREKEGREGGKEEEDCSTVLKARLMGNLESKSPMRGVHVSQE